MVSRTQAIISMARTKIRRAIIVWQAVWATRVGKESVEQRQRDVSAVSLEETVRIPLGQWPDSIVVTASGLRKDILANELLSKVKPQDGQSGVLPTPLLLF